MLSMLYKRKAITERFRLRRTKRDNGTSAYCIWVCPRMTREGNSTCSDLCYRLSDYNSTYEQYIKHKLRYIGM